MAAEAARDYSFVDKALPREAWKGKRQVAARCQGGVNRWWSNNY